MLVPALRSATEADYRGICALLEQEGLPTEDLRASHLEFVIAADDIAAVGIGALQSAGTSALLRSIAVDAAWRGLGVGEAIVRDLERRAQVAGATQLVLLTQTASGFFERLGYRVTERTDVPAGIRDTAEFRALCPASAVCMTKTLLP